MSTVTVILVTYNSAEVITRALGSLPADVPVIVVDNASVDATCARVEAACPRARILKNGKNTGFGWANNRALREVDTAYALLLNPDAALEPGALEALLDAAQRSPDAAIIAPLLIESDGSVFECKRDVFARERAGGRWVVPEGDACFPWISGAAWLLRMSALDHIGLFDENIFLYYEDDDLCLRTRQTGYSLIAAPQARARHSRGTSSTPSPEGARIKQFHLAWSRLYLEQKYHGRAAARQLALKKIAVAVAKTIAALLTLRPHKARRAHARIAGSLAFLGE